MFKDILRSRPNPPENALDLRLAVPSKCLSEKFGLRDGAIVKGVICEVLDWSGKRVDTGREGMDYLQG